MTKAVLTLKYVLFACLIAAAVALSLSLPQSTMDSQASAFSGGSLATGSDVCGTIAADTTWGTGGSPYTITCDVLVAEDVTLTVNPGVLVQGKSDQMLTVRGELVAAGTAADPVTFTSLDDMPGGAAWLGIDVDGGRLDMQHTHLRDATHHLFQHNSALTIRNAQPGDARITNSHFKQNFYSGLLVVNGSAVVKDSVFEENGDTGAAALVALSGTLSVRDTTFKDNGGYGLWTGEGTALTAVDNNFVNNGSYPLVIEPANLHRAVSGSTFSGNSPNRVLVEEGALEADTSLPTVSGLEGYEFTGDLSVPKGITLLVGPGNTLFMRHERFIVRGQLVAAGIPEAPILFTSHDDSAPGWSGISLKNGAARLQDTTVRYTGGVGGDALLVENSQLALDRVTLFDNMGSGLHLTGDLGQTVITRSAFVDNDSFGIRNETGGELDARGNWWGHPFGPYHRTLNPDGLGDKVSDDVLFDPWWKTADGPTTDELFAGISGPKTASPGAYVDYAISYANFTAEPLENAVLIVDLPGEADYVDSSSSATIWPERRQVFWKLGTVTPGMQGAVSLRLRYAWGIPLELEEQMLVILAGTVSGVTRQATSDPLAPSTSMPSITPFVYLDYDPVLLLHEEKLTPADIEAERRAYPEFDALYQAAIAEDFVYGIAYRHTYDNGSVVTRVILLCVEEQKFIFLERLGNEVLSTEFGPTSMIVSDTEGGVVFDLVTHAWSFFGNWDQPQTALMESNGLAHGHCFMNCLLNQVPGYLLGKAAAAAGAIFSGINCGKCGLGGVWREFDCGSCAASLFNTYRHGTGGTPIPLVGEVLTVIQCGTECADDPDQHICKQDKQQCSSGGIYGLFGVASIETCVCDTKLQRYARCETTRTCAIFQKCIEGTNGPQCSECFAENTLSADSAAGFYIQLDEKPELGCAQGSTRIERAHDPNEKYGVDGDVTPGQLLDYRITIENEGTGTAYGVFVVDKLDAALDENTLQINGSGEFLPASRALVWDIGELAQKGEAGSTDEVSFSVRVWTNAAEGTLISNQATVHFPSVPEETKTNSVLNEVSSLAAVPQTVQTESGKSVAITLQGREINGLSLTYRLVDEPLHGELTGTLPDLTYTAGSNFNGNDMLRFTVSNGERESRPAAVQIDVLPAADDQTPPEVIWASPADGVRLTQVSSEPYLTDDEGALYAPAVLIRFSEPIKSSTVTAQTVSLSDDSGRQLLTTLHYEEAGNRVVVLLREPLDVPAVYTVKVTKGIRDRRDNALAANSVWHFSTGEMAFDYYMPIAYGSR